MTDWKRQSWRRAFACAFAGICCAFADERNMKLHAGAAAAAVIFGFVGDLARWEWCVLLLAVMAVLTAELINTAIERAVDFVSPEYRREAKLIKDLAAGAVLTAAGFAALLGGLLLAPRLLP